MWSGKTSAAASKLILYIGNSVKYLFELYRILFVFSRKFG